MSRLFWLPIEPLEERYSAQWLGWWEKELTNLRVDHCAVLGEQLGSSISVGQFLDAFGTHFYKAHQTKVMAALLRDGGVRAGDAVLLHDAWSPAVTALAYMRDVSGIAFKIVGMMHAGTWDPWDHLSRCGLGRWAQHVERGWVEAVDAVCVATEFHRDLICKATGVDEDRVIVTGFPLYAGDWSQSAAPWGSRRKLVVFPHRLAHEKQPDEFDKLRDMYQKEYPGDDVQWVRTKDVCATKGDYYRLLGSARVAVSTAQQETWGIAMLEAATLGCYPVVPSRLSYPEIFSSCYASDEHAVAEIHRGLNADFAYRYAGRARWEGAIKRIVDVCFS